MIILTADIHNRLPNAWVQKAAGRHEVLLGQKYAAIALEHGIKPTFFVAGKALEEMPAHCGYLREEGVEVGGHTWSSYYPAWPHRISKLLCGRYSGLPILQSSHISRVARIINNTLGKTMTSWRGHGYLGDDYTYRELARNGVFAVSDEAGPRKSVREVNDMISLPINAIPDHEYLELTARGRFNPCADEIKSQPSLKKKIKTFFPKDRSRCFTLEPFSASPLAAEEWFEILRNNIEDNILNSRVTTLLIHPVTMEALDGMDLFRRVIKYLLSLDQESLTVTEAAVLYKIKRAENKSMVN